MPKITQEMKDLIASQKCFFAAISPDGTPDLGPKGSIRVLDEEHLVFTESYGQQTWSRLQGDDTVGIAAIDLDTCIGFRFVGNPEVLTTGELFDEANAARSAMPGTEKVRAVIRLKIDKIFNLNPSNPEKEIM